MGTAAWCCGDTQVCKAAQNARKYEQLTYSELIAKKLAVIDLTSAAMCDENDIDMIIFDMNVEGNIKRAAQGENIGTKIRR